MTQKILNEQQRQAVEFRLGPLLIIAGAGTGKTTVITERIKHLIDTKQADPSEILALTFTEKSAREMEERVDIAMPYGFTQLWIGTFHSFCDRILRNEAISIGLTPGYKLMTQAEAVSLLRKNIFSLNLDYFRPLGNPTKFISGILTHFSRLKDEDVSPQNYLKWVKKQQGDSEEEVQEIKKWKELAFAFEEYEKLKIKNGFMDFGDLISNTLLLFRKRPNILSLYRKQFKYILVDEFQDTNFAQYELIKLLAPPDKNPNLTVVGDDSQSIYKFRGAAISNILSFMKDFPNAKQVLLNQNYRSTQAILDLSHALIKHNDPDTLEAKLGISKKLISTRDASSHDVVLIQGNRVEDEAEEVIEAIREEVVKNKRNYKDFAILVRANNHADAFVRALRRQNIPYQFLGPGMLFRQDEIKDLIAYLKILHNPEDSISFYRVLTMKIWDLPLRDLATLGVFAKRYSLSLFEASEIVVGHEHRLFDGTEYALPFLSSNGKEALKKIIDMIYRHLERIATDTAGQILFYFLEDSGLIRELTNFETSVAEKKAQNISKFFDKLKTYEVEHDDASVAAINDWIDLSMELGESPLATDTDWFDNDAVNILTIHSSKGLEFPVVFLVNLATGRFPTYERREQVPIPGELIKDVLPTGDYHLQEERRLFYVGMTRARDRLFLTAANYYGEGKREKKISSFVIESLGEKSIEKFKAAKVEVSNVKQLSFLDFANHEANSQQSTFNGNEKRTLAFQRLTPITYLSYSQIETFKFCPLHYKAKYILKIPTPTYAAATFGKTLHDTLKHFYMGVMKGEEWEKEKLLSLYKEHWNSAGFEGKTHMEKMKKLGEEYLSDFIKYFHPQEPMPLTVEKPFIFSVSPKLKVGGVIDRINRLPDGRVEIVDYKTSNKIPTQKDVDKNLQLTVYALALLNVPGLSPVKNPKDFVLSLYFFNDHQKISTTRTARQLEHAKEEIVQIADEIATSDFKCSGTEWCKTCEYKMLCGVEETV